MNQYKNTLNEINSSSHTEETLASVKKIYDLTAILSEKSVVFPGDPTYSMEKISSLEEGKAFNLCHVHFGNHSGTHIDYPAHVISEGKTSSDYPIELLTGAGIIIKVPDTDNYISKQFISEQPIKKNDIVFFKTANSNHSKQTSLRKYVYIEPEAAKELLNKGVKIVGIDYISVDRYESEDLPVHHCLLSNDILIVEGLELNHAPIGRCDIFIMPLNIANMDGLPVRVIAQKW